MFSYHCVCGFRIASTDTNHGQKLSFFVCSSLVACRARKQKPHSHDFFWLTASQYRAKIFFFFFQQLRRLNKTDANHLDWLTLWNMPRSYRRRMTTIANIPLRGWEAIIFCGFLFVRMEKCKIWYADMVASLNVHAAGLLLCGGVFFFVSSGDLCLGPPFLTMFEKKIKVPGLVK